jgi:hypothetical protein
LQGLSTAAIHAFEQALKLKNLPRTYALLAEEKCKIRDLNGAQPMLRKVIHDYVPETSIVAVAAPRQPMSTAIHRRVPSATLVGMQRPSLSSTGHKESICHFTSTR